MNAHIAHIVACTMVLAVPAVRAAPDPGPAIPTRIDIARANVPAADRAWQRAEAPDPRLGARELFSAALIFCEANTNLDRIDRLLERAEQMQDRKPESRTYGNFRWYWENEDVFDLNAVDFCMQTAAPLWMFHREKLNPAQRAKLKQLIELGLEGLRRHKVSPTYTNIVLMNAGALILLGEATARPADATEGYARLDRYLLAMWENGTHEYVSPTYYAVDLDDLILIEAFAQRESGRNQARALLEFFWTDLALNWFPAADKLAGARSREYDYVTGLGSIDQHLLANGWTAPDAQRRLTALATVFAAWRPPARLKELRDTKYPRLVEQIWGAEPNQTRTLYLCRDIGLGTAGAGYGGWMDLPLCVDLPGQRTEPRAYFIPDGRHDPYGKIKIPNGRAHLKTLHLQPFWAAAQRRVDALGLAVYRGKDVTVSNLTLESHFVMRKNVDRFWIGDRRIAFDAAKESRFEVRPGEALVCRKGTAAFGVRVPWTRGEDGHPATVALVDDRNAYGVVRLTVEHARIVDTNAPGRVEAGAAFWVRIGSGLDTDAAFEKWRADFAAAHAEVTAGADRIHVQTAGQDGLLTLTATAPYEGTAALCPVPKRHLLAIDGEDLGRPLIANLEPVKAFRTRLARITPVRVAVDAPALWEAENARVFPPMMWAADATAAGGEYVWMPADEGGGGRTAGATWTLDVADPGVYRLWGRVRAPTPENDSFFLRVTTADQRELRPQIAWMTGVHKDWTWIPLTEDGRREPAVLDLPSGTLRLHLGVRESGTAIDRLFLTADPTARPPE